MVKVVQIRGLMMNIKRMIPYGVIDCYRYVAIGLLAVLPLVSYSEARLMQPIEEVRMEEIAPVWLDKPISSVPSVSVQTQSTQQPFSRQAFAIHKPVKTTVEKADAQIKRPTKSPSSLQKVNVAEPAFTESETSERSKFSIASLHETAQQGNVESQYQLGIRYQYGDDVVMDINKANQWLAKAAISGDARAQHALSMFYQRYATNIEGAKKALLWEKKAADNGSADAQYALGVMFKNGRLVRKNEAEARRWLTMAAQQGHFPAQLVLQE